MKKKPMTVRRLQAELKKHMKELATTRDKLRLLQYECEDLEAMTVDAEEALEQVVEKLSERV